MRSRPKAYFLSVGRVFTWVNMVQAKCLIGSKGEEARSEQPPPRCVSHPRCPTHGWMHYDQLQLQCGIRSSNHLFTRRQSDMDSMPGIVLGTEDTTLNRVKVPVLTGWTF